jgi:subtilisin family serine protease
MNGVNRRHTAVSLALTVVAAAAAMSSACAPNAFGVTPTPAPTGPCTQDILRRLLPASGILSHQFAVREAQRTGSDTYPGLIEVRYRSSLRSQQAEAHLSSIGATAQPQERLAGWVVYKLPPRADPIAEASFVGTMPGVAYAGPAHARYLESAVVPDDTEFGTNALATQPGGDTTTAVQWDMWRTDMIDAWGITEGSGNIKIGIVDTGFDASAPDLDGKVDTSAVFDSGTGRQATCSGVTIQDFDGHGTNVSGIAAAATNNNLAVAGTGWYTKLVEVRVFPYPPGPSATSPPASTADIAAAIGWAVSKGVKVINLSLGGGTCPDDPMESAAVENAISAGVTIVAAAGNDGANHIVAPACDPGVVSVGASRLDDFSNALGPPVEGIASYSNFGPSLDIVAPGGGPSAQQIAACRTGTCDFLQWIFNLYSATGIGGGGSLALVAGTSAATPHVSGVAALMYAKNGSISPATVKGIFDNPSNNDDICSGCAQEGHGRLNAFKALTATP